MSGRIFNIGIDVGGTNIKFAITDEAGAILFRDRKKTDAGRGADAIFKSIVQGVESMLSNADLRVAEVASIGLGIPGTVDSDTGLVVFAPNIFWKNVQITKEIRNAIDVPVYAAQDTRAAAWAEYRVGAGKGLKGVASITLGTGIGCGLVLDGKIFHGALNTAGEFGHQIVQLDGASCNCGRCGCLEAYAGGLAIVRQAKEQIDGIEDLLGPVEIEVHHVFQLAQEGNRQARRITDSLVKHVGMGMVSLINLISVELITLSGGISNAPAELLLDPLMEFVRTHAYAPVAGSVKICKSPLGEDAPLIGAALLYQAAVSE